MNTVNAKVSGDDWPLFDAKNQKYLLINTNSAIIDEKPFADEYTFWKDLPPHSALNSVPKT